MSLFQKILSYFNEVSHEVSHELKEMELRVSEYEQYVRTKDLECDERNRRCYPPKQDNTTKNRLLLDFFKYGVDVYQPKWDERITATSPYWRTQRERYYETSTYVFVIVDNQIFHIDTTRQTFQIRRIPIRSSDTWKSIVANASRIK
jgi:hypothetical protein